MEGSSKGQKSIFKNMWMPVDGSLKQLDSEFNITI